jgi:hypothetical protein
MLLKDRRLWIYDDEELINELANVRLKEPSPGLLRMDHDPQRHEDRAIAVALAALGENPTGGRVGSGLEAMGPVRRRDSFDHVVTAYNPSPIGTGRDRRAPRRRGAPRRTRRRCDIRRRPGDLPVVYV